MLLLGLQGMVARARLTTLCLVQPSVKWSWMFSQVWLCYEYAADTVYDSCCCHNSVGWV